MAQARGGLMSITGTPDGDPVKIGVPVCDLVCGLYLALGVVAALRERDRTGRGQYLDVSLYESAVSLAVWEAGRYFATGEVGRPLGSAHQNQAPYQAVRSADGWVTVGAITTRTWAGFCAALGLDELRDDERYADAFRRHAHRDELIASIEAATTALPTAELVELLDAAGVPCAPIADHAEVFTDEHLQARDFFWDADHPQLGPVRQLGSPMRLSAHPRPPGRRRPGPRGGHPGGAAGGGLLGAGGGRAGRRGSGRGGRRAGRRRMSGMQTPELAVEQDGAVLTVTFNRPSQRNAMTFAMYDGLYAACERADADDGVRVLVLRGAGDKAFVSGTDIAQFAEFRGGADGVAYEARITRVINRLEDVTVPTVAAIRGFCVGAGLAIAAACDLRVATRSARFGVPIARTLGNCLSMNTYSLLLFHLGPARSLDLLLRARLLSGEDAHGAGFVSELCADDALERGGGRAGGPAARARTADHVGHEAGHGPVPPRRAARRGRHRRPGVRQPGLPRRRAGVRQQVPGGVEGPVTS